MREPLEISEERLRACLQDQYGLISVTLEYLPLGKDYNAGVYRVVSEQGSIYLLKATSRSLYEPRCLVPRFLNDQGITSVVAPVATRSGTLWTKVEDWTVVVYPWISGESSFTGMTDGQWKDLGAIFKQIHEIVLPPFGFESLLKETFDAEVYTRWIHTFEARHLHAQYDGDDLSRALRASWVRNQPTIRAGVAYLEKLAQVLRSRSLPYVVCHADLHPANLLRDSSGRVFVIDWDEVMLAPKERDFIFIWEPRADAFWIGYEQREIDWVALTYYCWERVIQDVIECAKDVCLRGDLAEETRAEIAHLFDENLFGEGEGTVSAAYAAAARLPEDLVVHPADI